MRKDGRRIEVSLAVSPVLGEAGRVIAASTITRDVSEQKAAERKLAESARHFELINDLVATCGFDGYFKQLNGAWEPTLGWTAEELLPNPYADIIHPDDRDGRRARGCEARRGAERQPSSGSGSGRRTAAGAGPSGRRSPDLPSAAFHCVGREITERMEAERALAAERRQLADAQQLASVGSWELDLDQREPDWSAQQFRNHGFDPAEPIPELERVLERVHPDDQVAVLRRMADDTRRATTSSSSPTGWCSPTEGCARSQRGPAVHRRRGLDAVMGTSRDVTAERDAERLKDEFFGLVSHELRTPLTSIIGYTELLREIEAENLSEQGRRFVEVIERNSRRELSLVGDLLLLTRITAGTFEIELATRRPGGDDRRGHAPRRRGRDRPGRGRDRARAARGAGRSTGTRTASRQVVDNLLSNAIKFTPRAAGSTIRARATRSAPDRGQRHRDRNRRRRQRAAVRAHLPGRARRSAATSRAPASG